MFPQIIELRRAIPFNSDNSSSVFCIGLMLMLTFFMTIKEIYMEQPHDFFARREEKRSDKSVDL